MHARTEERYSPGELGTLARAFDDMAESLARREAEREQKEEALRESEERLRKLAETAPGAIHTLRVWPDGRRCFTYASPGIKAIYGFSPEELAKDAWPTFALMHPDDIERVHATTSEAIRTLSPWRCEFRVQLPEKGEIWVEGCSTPIREPDDSISWHGFLTDITERKRAESALRRSTERLQILHAIDCAILEAQSPSAIAQAALQRLRAVVPYTLSSIIFFDSEARVGRVFAVDPVVADQGAETSTYPLVGLRHVEAVLQGGEVFSEPDIKTKAQDIPAYAILQRQGICSLIAAPLVVEGALIGALGLGADRCDAFNPDHSEIILQVAVPLALAIQHARLNEQLLTQQRGETERVEAELARARQQLVQQTRLAAIGQVSASIAHDLRNPLGAIRNAAYLLKHRLPQEDSKWAEYLQVVEEEVLNADRIIGDLMEMTRAKAPTKQAVDLVALVRDIFHRSNLSNEVHWRCVCDPDPFLIWADPGQIRQVLNNLLLNAAQAMEEHGTIEVKAMRRAEWDVITVADTGPGVAPEDWQQIFEPLFTTKAKGTGLGLAICKQLIERHGGAIEMIPSHGFGSVFCIRLPRGQAAVSVMQATVS
ncbi:MAG: ATP-binding protein [Candidatus Binatia bacterium]